MIAKLNCLTHLGVAQSAVFKHSVSILRKPNILDKWDNHLVMYYPNHCAVLDCACVLVSKWGMMCRVRGE